MSVSPGLLNWFACIKDWLPTGDTRIETNWVTAGEWPQSNP